MPMISAANIDRPFGVITSIEYGGHGDARLIFAAVAALAGVSFSIQPAKAQAPWCAVVTIGEGSVYWDCSSLEQCRPNVLAGDRGFCNPSPDYGANATENRRSTKCRARPR
jgi:hypothetical protein